MNNNHLRITLISSFIVFLSLGFIVKSEKNSVAEVSKVEGVYIFTDSRPANKYQKIGEVELGFVVDTQYESIRNNLIKRAKKKYPDAEGLIMKFSKNGLDHCEVIIFIEE